MSTNDSRIKNWSTNPNTNGVGSPPFFWPEGQAPSTVNDCARQMMSDIRYQWEDAAWFQWGDTVSRASASTFKIAADVTSRYTAGRRVKAFDAATYYGTVVSSSYSAPDTTITLSMDSGSLTASLSAVALSILEPTNSPIPETSTANDAYPCLGRLTLESGVPISTTDQTGKTNIYFTPFGGNTIALYDGSANWQLFNFSELTLAVPATTNTLYDVYAYNNSGVVALEAASWGSDTTRSAIALTTVNGVYVKSGATTRRYIGNFRTTGSSGQTEDSLAKRYVWNYYNRVIRQMRVTDSTDSWNYSTASYRQANGSAANQIDFVIGIAEDSVQCNAVSVVSSSTSTPRTVTTGIGLDGTTNNATIFGWMAASTTIGVTPMAQYNAVIAHGRHYLTWLERGDGTDTQSWRGDNTAGVAVQAGINGFLRG